MESEIGADERVSAAIVRAVSAVVGREPASLRPLAEILDPDALDALFGPQSDGTARVGGRLSFVYGGCRVTVENGDYLALERLDAGPDPESGPGTRDERDR